MPLSNDRSLPVLDPTCWPSILASYSVGRHGGIPAVFLLLSLGTERYRGVRSVAVDPDNRSHLLACFTDQLDRTSAGMIEHYSAVEDITITRAELLEDHQSVMLTTEKPIPEGALTLQVTGIESADGEFSFSGETHLPSSGSSTPPVSTIQTNAVDDLEIYTKIVAYIETLSEIEYHLRTSLTTSPISFTTEQKASLLDRWLPSICQFLKERSEGIFESHIPDLSCHFTFPLQEEMLNPERLYRLDFSMMVVALEREDQEEPDREEPDQEEPDREEPDREESDQKSEKPIVSPPPSEVADDRLHQQQIVDPVMFAREFEEGLEGIGDAAWSVAVVVEERRDLTPQSPEFWVAGLPKVRGDRDPEPDREREGRDVSFRIDQTIPPAIVAIPPLSKELLTESQVPIPGFDEATGISFDQSPAHFLDFSGIDLNLWLRELFIGLDQMMTPSCAATITLIDAERGSNHRETIMAIREEYAAIVAGWISPVTTDQNRHTHSLRDTFYRQLLNRLDDAFIIVAGIEQTAIVDAGSFHVDSVSFNPDETDSVLLTFSSDLTTATAEDLRNYSCSDGLNVIGARQDPDHRERVTLQLSGSPVVGKTTISFVPELTDCRGSVIFPPHTVTVSHSVINRPTIDGSILQNLSATKNGLKNRESQNVSFSSSRLTLKNSDTVPLPFLLLTEDDHEDRDEESLPVRTSLQLDASYHGRSADQPHRAMRSPEEKGSILLNFLTDPDGLIVDLGSMKIPLPDLHPIIPPVLVRQSAEPSCQDEERSLKEICQWTYSFEYSRLLHAPHDELAIEITLHGNDRNGSGRGGERSDAEIPLHSPPHSESLRNQFIRLAQFTTRYPEIAKILQVSSRAISTGEADATQIASAAIAIESFITLALHVLDSLRTDATLENQPVDRESIIDVPSPSLEASGGHDQSICRLQIRERVATIGREEEGLVVRLQVEGNGAEKTAPPLVEIPGYRTHLVAGSGEDDITYWFSDSEGRPLTAAQGERINLRRVTLPTIDILHYAGAESSVQITRNRALLPEATITPDFISRTEAIRFPEPLMMSIQYDREIQLQSIGRTGPQIDTLNGQLANFFDNLFAEFTHGRDDGTSGAGTSGSVADHPAFVIDLNCTYSHTLGSDLPLITIPVLLIPPTPITPAPSDPGGNSQSLEELTTRLSDGIVQWFTMVQPSRTEGRVDLDLKISSHQPEQSEQYRPILQLSRLSLPIMWVQDLRGM